MNVQERVKMVRAMDLIARSLNDEMLLMRWFSGGVADGDYKLSDEDLECYVTDDEDFEQLMTLFRKLVSHSDLYFDGVCSE